MRALYICTFEGIYFLRVLTFKLCLNGNVLRAFCALFSNIMMSNKCYIHKNSFTWCNCSKYALVSYLFHVIQMVIGTKLLHLFSARLNLNLNFIIFGSQKCYM